ncbi:MAG TPA: KTSC domain-containing protein [Chitinophagaceae bacterium]|nr:KTSC domain-containing protein [Chitinophagaceae bacterium]
MPSSVIANIVYESRSSTLRVRFLSGAVYEYKKVPVTVYDAMKTAFSKGTFLNKYIKGNYPFKKIT